MADELTRKRNKKRKKKRPTPVTSVESTQRKDNYLINKFHTLMKIQESVKKSKKLSIQERDSKLLELDSKMNKLGGIDAYQKASKLGEQRNGGFNSAKWVVRKLKEHNITGSSGKLRLLDVGALDCNYTKHRSWIECTAIDLNPQNSLVVKADFLTLPSHKQYDVVVLSLVINFEGDAHRRGDMLKLCTKIIVNNGFLFIVLPLPCVNNSRFLSQEMFLSMVKSLGFGVISAYCSRKLFFVMLKNNGNLNPHTFSKKAIRTGKNCNNFTILL